ncbi:hypothetical protein E4U55_001806 [Claviceps digitariae]|nr:hypothetical protein E4U55_001806 [Claviceps digitariae]
MAVAVAAFLMSSACAVPYSLPMAVHKTNSTVQASTSILAAKKPNVGKLMPSDNCTSINTPSAGAPRRTSRIERRLQGQRVQNDQLATYRVDDIIDGNGDGADLYVMYMGKGSTSEEWPAQSEWVSFENMFENYKSQMFKSCGRQHPPQTDNTESEVAAIYEGIQQAAAATGVDHRFILAIMMQESHGCVRSPTTNYGVRNPGLMQDHDGNASCNENGVVQYPCPASTIYEMILEGTAGTRLGDGLANCMNRAGESDVSAFYKAARIYNSGAISFTGDLQNGFATHCYASDIANRLTGWVDAPSKCTCDEDPDSCSITYY